MDRQFDPRRPQGTSWTSVTPSTPTFNPTKFTPGSQQSTWKPSFSATNRSDSQEIIIGNVQQDSSGGFVHTFGGPKKPETPVSNQSAPWRNSPSRQDSVNSSATPRYVQEIVVPTGQAYAQTRSPVRQQSYQSNPSQFSPVQQSPQVSSPVYFQPQNNGYDNRPNGGTPVTVYPSVRQSETPYLRRQESIPQQVVRQESKPFQRQESRPFQRQDSIPYQNQDSNVYHNAPRNTSNTSVSSPYQSSRQDSWNQQTPSRQESWSSQPQTVFQPARQNSYSNSSVNATSPSYPTSRQDSFQQQSPSYPSSTPDSFNQQTPSWSNQPSVYQPARQDSYSHSPVTASSQSPGSWSSQPIRPESVPYQPPSSNAAPGLFAKQSPKDSPTSYAPTGLFTRQQSTSGPKPWSPGPVESFPTPPPFSPSSEASGVPWPVPNLPSPPPPPPPPPINAPIVNSAPVVAPPPPPPPPPMPPSAGMNQEVPPWKKQIQATKEAKAAAGISQTPGTPGTGGQELPAALANSMKKDKKPFTYLPGGLDLSEIRSPKMQRRLMAHQQQAPPAPSTMGHQVLLQPRQNFNTPQQVQNQMEGLNLGESESMAAAVNANDPAHPGQSRSFRILQMMTGGDDETDSVAPSQGPRRAAEPEEEVRFTGIRRPDNPIPSRAFQTLQKMTQGTEQAAPQNPIDNRFANEYAEEGQQDDTPVDIRYKGGYIPGRSFKMLQEMTGMNEDGEPTGTVVPSVLEAKRQQRKPNLHLNINQHPQSPPPPKQFPQPSIPASQQKGEDAPTMYQGARIPSKSFRMLQAMTGESGEDGTDM